MTIILEGIQNGIVKGQTLFNLPRRSATSDSLCRRAAGVADRHRGDLHLVGLFLR